MCDSPRNSEHALFYDNLQPLVCGGDVNIFYDFINELINYKGVCRAAWLKPGPVFTGPGCEEIPFLRVLSAILGEGDHSPSSKLK